MVKREILKDYLLRGGAKNRAFVTDDGQVYIIKDFRWGENSANNSVIDADLIGEGNSRKRVGLPLSGRYAHLYDWKATLSQVKAAGKGLEVSLV